MGEGARVSGWRGLLKATRRNTPPLGVSQRMKQLAMSTMKLAMFTM